MSNNIAIRAATPADGGPLQALQARCPQGQSLILSTVNTPNFFARAQSYQNVSVFVAERDGQIVGSAAAAVREMLLNGQQMRVGYEFQYFVDPTLRRVGVARALREHINAHLIAQDAAITTAMIIEGNTPSMGLFAAQGFQRHALLPAEALLIYKPMPHSAHIRQATPQDLPAITTLINQMRTDYGWRGIITADGLGALLGRMVAFDYASLLILEENGQPVACMGYWDWGQITQVTIKALPWHLRLLMLALGLAGRFTRLPRPLHVGDTMRQWAVVFAGVSQPQHAAALLAEINNRALQGGADQLIVMGGTLQDPVIAATKAYIGVSSPANLYAKPLKAGVILPPSVYLEGVDL
jgi:N-acetylglutamate synthase-like GNAT family acetyltransferase